MQCDTDAENRLNGARLCDEEVVMKEEEAENIRAMAGLGEIRK